MIIICVFDLCSSCPSDNDNLLNNLIELDKSRPIKPTPPPPKSGFASSGNVLGMIATIGGALFVCNLCLLYCYVKRRAGKHICGKSHHQD